MSIEVFNESSDQHVNEDLLVDVARYALARMDVHSAAELTIQLVDEPAMEELHVRWMDLPGPTDVMSFPMDELRPSSGRPDADDPGPAMLGDIVLCPEFAARQAKKAGRDPLDELALLTVHGVLHLLGYDHAEPKEERRMFFLQTKILYDYFNKLKSEDKKFLPRPDAECVFPTAADMKWLERNPDEADSFDDDLPAIPPIGEPIGRDGNNS